MLYTVDKKGLFLLMLIVFSPGFGKSYEYIASSVVLETERGRHFPMGILFTRSRGKLGVTFCSFAMLYARRGHYLRWRFLIYPRSWENLEALLYWFMYLREEEAVASYVDYLPSELGKPGSVVLVSVLYAGRGRYFRCRFLTLGVEETWKCVGFCDVNERRSLLPMSILYLRN